MSDCRSKGTWSLSQDSILEDHVIPDWATGVLSTRRQGAPGTESLSHSLSAYTETVDLETQFAIVVASGLYVIEFEPEITQTRFTAAVHLARRLMSHPLDLGAFALPNGFRFTDALVGKLAQFGILVVDTEGADAHDRAVSFVRSFLARRNEGLEHLHRCANAYARETR